MLFRSEVSLPKLNAEDYEITDNGDGTLTYTLKDRAHGKYSFIVPVSENEVSENLWPYIIVAVAIVIITLTLLVTIIKKSNNKKVDTKATI